MDTALSAAEAEADVFRDLVARRKVVESRFNLGVYSRVKPGMLLCCRYSAQSPCAWFQVQRVKHFQGFALSLPL